MSGNSSINYDKISKKCCGIRLNPRRFSVQRLRTNFVYIVRVFKRWRRNSYRSCLRLLRRINLVRRRSRTKAGFVQTNKVSCGFSSTSYSVVRTMNHSNSFCSEAIADCLEFIKRNSVSIDDDMSPMLHLNQDH